MRASHSKENRVTKYKVPGRWLGFKGNYGHGHSSDDMCLAHLRRLFQERDQEAVDSLFLWDNCPDEEFMEEFYDLGEESGASWEEFLDYVGDNLVIMGEGEEEWL